MIHQFWIFVESILELFFGAVLEWTVVELDLELFLNGFVSMMFNSFVLFALLYDSRYLGVLET